MVAPLLRNNPGGVVSNAPFGTGGSLPGNNPGGVVANTGGPLLPGGGLPSGQIDWLANLEQLAQWLGWDAARKIERLLRDERTAATTRQDLANLMDNPGSVAIPDILSSLDDYYSRYFPGVSDAPAVGGEGDGDGNVAGVVTPPVPPTVTPPAASPVPPAVTPPVPPAVTPSFNPYAKGRVGWSFTGKQNPFFDVMKQHGYEDNTTGNENTAFGDLVGMTGLAETDDDIFNAWAQYRSANAPEWSSATNRFADTKRDQIIADYRQARAQDPTLRAARFFAGLDLEKNSNLADPYEAFRSNPFFRTRRL